MAQEDVAEERAKELRDICIEFKINSPLLGEDLYNPNAPDLSRDQQRFSDKISQLCTQRNFFHQYIKSTRETLDM